VPILEAAAHWVSLVLHRAELVEQIARAAAEQARRGVAEDLIAALAHDLRNLIAPATARIDLIHRHAAREGLDRYVRQAHEAARALQRMEALISDLLDAARLEQGIFTLRREHVNLAALVEEAAAVLRRDDADIRVQVAEAICADGDPARIRQALENLVMNALQHSPAGVPVILDVSTRRDAAGIWAVVEVRDGGPGIAPEIFSRFHAGEGSQGLGLGLYLAHGVATAHGGGLAVASAVGAGARFCLSLPACDLHPRA
jgi:signal transduction histidine kinase